jgi:hypothetical protein
MQNILSKIFHTNNTKPANAILKSFTAHFGRPINVEWHKEKENYEALFYIEDIEHIALFSPDGRVIETKRNLLLSSAKPEIAKQALIVGEMMNLIEIERNGKFFYEIIARDLYLDRYYILLDNEGNMLDKRKL